MSTSVNKEIWIPAIEDNFYTEWERVKTIAKDDSIYVDAKQVHIPNAGSVGTLLKNNSSYPVSAEERTDTINTYDVDSYQMPPIRIGRFDSKDLTYDKTLSVVKDQTGNIGERIKYDAYVNWYIGKESGKHVETSGTGTSTSSAPGSSATVKDITIADVIEAKGILDKQKIPQTGRILLLPVDMFHQLHAELISDGNTIFMTESDGFSVLDKPFAGFKVVMDTEVVNTTSTGTARAYGHSGASGDLQAGLAYHKDQVSVAKKDIFVEFAKGPGMYGETVEAESWAGSKYRREDKKGIVPILQKVD